MVIASQQAAGSQFDVGATYDEHRRLLLGTAIARYGIAETDAEALVHDVFLTYLVGCDDVRDTRAWLLSAICNASKSFLRRRGRDAGLSSAIDSEPDPSTFGVSDRLHDELAVRQCFTCLTPRCQLALHLRYIEGYSVPEIAAELGTSAKYAQKLVSRCLQQAQDRYAKGTV